MSEKIVSALNAQINHEMWSSYMYYAMSNFFYEKNLNGFAHWMYQQHLEERVHAEKIIAHLRGRNAKVEFKAIQAVPNTWQNCLDAFKVALEHEKQVTKAINSLMDLSISEKDYASQNLLMKYVDEQIEEEESFRGIVDLLERLIDNPLGIYTLNKELGNRS